MGFPAMEMSIPGCAVARRGLFKAEDLVGGEVEDLTDIGERFERRILIEPHVFADGRGVDVEFFREFFLRDAAPFDLFTQTELNFFDCYHEKTIAHCAL